MHTFSIPPELNNPEQREKLIIWGLVLEFFLQGFALICQICA